MTANIQTTTTIQVWSRPCRVLRWIKDPTCMEYRSTTQPRSAPTAVVWPSRCIALVSWNRKVSLTSASPSSTNGSKMLYRCAALRFRVWWRIWGTQHLICTCRTSHKVNIRYHFTVPKTTINSCSKNHRIKNLWNLQKLETMAARTAMFRSTNSSRICTQNFNMIRAKSSIQTKDSPISIANRQRLYPSTCWT